jgi:ferredoxin
MFYLLFLLPLLLSVSFFYKIWKSMKKVIIHPGCIACGTCQFICPAVFSVTNRSSVTQDANLEAEWENVKKAEQSCPVSVIQCKEE